MQARDINELPDGCRLISIPTARDERGELAFAEVGNHVPFAVERVFWIYDVPAHAKRGGHAHRTCAELVFAVAGGFTMVVDDGHNRKEVSMDTRDTGILIPAGMWCELKDFEPGTVLVVLASQPYIAEGYINNYSNYLEEVGAGAR